MYRWGPDKECFFLLMPLPAWQLLSEKTTLSQSRYERDHFVPLVGKVSVLSILRHMLKFLPIADFKPFINSAQVHSGS
jgi:hypothetical protein